MPAIYQCQFAAERVLISLNRVLLRVINAITGRFNDS